jgi:stage IV sporulation protein B
MWVRDSIAGIGTITYIEPESGEFAGLGHGICDTATGALLPISRGVVVHAEIRGIRKGAPGSPGELRGQFSSGRIGVLNMNAAQGVFGVLTELPVNVCEETAVPIAMKEEILDGEATLLCTVDENGAKEYSVTIRKIKNGSGDKNMEITVTDPELLEKTGGIVQGMSGSPLLQNGRLIGAVTHVLINNPAKGYGIYIENMLRAVQEAKTNGNMRQEGN